MNEDANANSRLGQQLMIGALAALSTLGAADTDAAVDIFLKMGTIKGESKDDKHRDEIDVLSWSWGLHRPPSPVSNPSSPQRRLPTCSLNFVVAKFVDRATPALVERATLGTSIPLATLYVRRSGARQDDFMFLELTDLTVESMSGNGSAGGGSLPIENVTFAFSSAKLKYKPQKLDGSLDAEIIANLPSPCP